MAMRIAGFTGLVPRAAGRSLLPSQAQIAVNCRLTSGYLGAFREPVLVAALTSLSDVLTFYRSSDGVTDAWLEWTKDVDAQPAPIDDGTEGRVYYSGDFEPRVTNYALATAGAQPYPFSKFVLGVSPPRTAPAVAPSGGAPPTETRSYVETFVTAWGEESKPGPASVAATGNINGTWALTGLNTAPPNAGTISAAVHAAGKVTVTHNSVAGLRAGEEIKYSAVGGMTSLNGRFKIFSVNVGTNQVVVELTTAQVYTAGGAWDRIALHNFTGGKKRIYRTVTTDTTQGFLFVAELPITDTTYNDVVASAGPDSLKTTLWSQPPTDLIGLCSMANGIMAGFRSGTNQVCFSEAFVPYAWPVNYRQSTRYKIVGTAAFGSSLLCATQGFPEIATGVDPSAMSLETILQQWPCLSKRSVREVGYGAGFATREGWVVAGAGGVKLVTQGLYTDEEWAKLSPEQMLTVFHAGRVYAFYETTELFGNILILNPSELSTLVNANFPVTAARADLQRAKLYIVSLNKVYEWDADAGQRMIYDWLSGEMIFQPSINLGAAKVDAAFTMTPADIAAAQASNANAVALNQALITGLALKSSLNAYSTGQLSINGSLLQPLPVLEWESLQFSLYADGVLVYSVPLVNSLAFRLPDGYKSDQVTVRLSGNVNVKGVVLGSSMVDLKTA